MAKQVERKMVKAKACPFCKDDAPVIEYKDTGMLRKFI